MDETTLRIRKKVEEFLNVQVNSIERIENVPNKAQSQNQCLTVSPTTDGGCIR